jgi:hypothetical protein
MGRATRAGTGLAAAAATEAALIHLGRTYGSTREERAARLAGDDLIPDATVQTDHAITPSRSWSSRPASDAAWLRHVRSSPGMIPVEQATAGRPLSRGGGAGAGRSAG